MKTTHFHDSNARNAGLVCARWDARACFVFYRNDHNDDGGDWHDTDWSPAFLRSG